MKAIVIAAALFLVATGALAQKTVLRFSTAAPPPDFLSRSLAQFKAELEKAAPEFDVQVYAGSQLFRQGTEVPALQRGNLEMNSAFSTVPTCSATMSTLIKLSPAPSASATPRRSRRRWAS